MNFKEYVINMFEKIADLTPERLFYLNKMLDRINASKYTKQQFDEAFSLEDIGFFTLLAFLLDEQNLIKLEEFGDKFREVEQQKSLS